LEREAAQENFARGFRLGPHALAVLLGGDEGVDWIAVPSVASGRWNRGAFDRGERAPGILLDGCRSGLVNRQQRARQECQGYCGHAERRALHDDSLITRNLRAFLPEISMEVSDSESQK
jgi:hypothetical protein